MNKKQRNEQPDLNLAHKGMIPWSTMEFYSMYANVAKSKQKSGGNNTDDMLLLVEVFQKEYPDELEFKAHIYRFHLIKKFVFKHAMELMKDGFAATEGKAGFRDELMDVLCTLPYSLEQTEKSGEKTYLFLYSEVKNAALKKINAHLN